MALFSRNEDATTIPLEYASQGKRLGFLGALDAGWEQQIRASSSFGLEVALRAEEQENIQKIRKLGGKAPASLNDSEDGTFFAGMTAGLDSQNYTELVRALHEETGAPQSGPDSRERGRSYAVAGTRNDELRKLQQQFPNAGIRTYDEMFDTVKQKALAAERTRTMNPTTFMGSIGGFIGDVIGGVDLRVNPIAFASLPAGGGGKSIITRAATEAGVQGVVEAFNQFTGVREQRDILGLEQNTTSSIVGAVVGGAAIQGVGEAVRLGFRGIKNKWFRNIPGDPAPPMPEVIKNTKGASVKTAAVTEEPKGLEVPQLYERSPLAASRLGTARAMDDMASAHMELSSWSGPAPWELTPPTSTALPRDIDLSGGSPVRALSEGETLDEIARRVDPDAFRAYDKLVKQKAAHSNIVQTFHQAEMKANAERIDNEIAQLRSQKATPEIEQRIAALEAQKSEPIPVSVEPGDVSKARAAQIATDTRIEKLTPTIERAYARAQNKWNLYEGQRAQIREMIKSGGSTLPPFALQEKFPEPAPVIRTPAEDIPEMNNIPVDATIRPEQFKTAADYVQRVQQENKRIADEAIEGYRASVSKLLKPEGDSMTLKVDGAKYELHLDKDKIAVPNENGEGFKEVSVRQLLEDVDEGNKLLEAVSTCSVR